MQIDLGELWKTEQSLKKRVEETPTSIKARSDLANCLALLAAYKAGQEAVLGNAAKADARDSREPFPNRTAADLFKEHLWHMRVLSVLPGERSGAGDSIHSTIAFHLAPGLDAEVKEMHDNAMRKMISDMHKTSPE